jgi:predicted ATPase
MPVNINIAELNYILAATPSQQNIMLVGEHGIGKSRIISEYFKS